MKKGCLVVAVLLVVLSLIGRCGIGDALDATKTAGEASTLAPTPTAAPAPVDTMALRRSRSDLATLSKEIEAVRGDTTFRHPSLSKFVNGRTGIVPYLVTAGPGLQARMMITYVADEWLFVKKFTIRTDAGLYELTPDAYGPGSVERDNGDGKIWEWWDVRLEPHRAMLKDIAQSNQVLVRFEGRQYYRDWQVPERDKRAIERLLSASLARPQP